MCLGFVWLLLFAGTVTTTITFPDFSDLTPFTLNGSAQAANTGDGDVLRLTPNSVAQAGSAYLTQATHFPAGASFSSNFCFRIGPAGGADGFVFVVQSQGADALGGAGGGFAYTGVAPSVAIEFDTYDNGGEAEDHIAVDVNGSVSFAAGTAAGFDLDSNTLLCAWVEYTGGTNALEVRIANSTTRPAVATLATVLDVQSTVGPAVHFGFAAGTGGETNAHDIVSWTLQVTVLQIPTLGTAALALFGLALAGLAIVVLRR